MVESLCMGFGVEWQMGNFDKEFVDKLVRFEVVPACIHKAMTDIGIAFEVWRYESVSKVARIDNCQG